MSTINNDASVVTYLASYDIPLNVTIMTRAQQWPFLQQLNYNGMISYINQDFHGVQDFYDQMTIYSATNTILNTAWATIRNIAKLNLNVDKEMYTDPDLGQVGLLFAQLPGFSKLFSVSSIDDSSDITSKVDVST